ALSRHKVSVKVKKREVKFHTDFEGFIGSSQPMQVVYKMIESSANSRATCFITGESGTGKEVAAEAIHKLSNRRAKPFVVLNCAAIPKDLMESEIFGHIKGAFTGAVSDHDGAATRANGGTLFLDEICEMDLHLQSKLLRFIQTETFNKVGSGKTEKVNIRFVCATNRDPLVEIGAGRFREDLYYRLHVIPIPLPALRDRQGDVIAIATKFLKTFASEEEKDFVEFSPEAVDKLATYPWPGNVRQLQNVIRNTVVLNQGQAVEVSMLPPPLNTDSLPTSSLASMGVHTQPQMPPIQRQNPATSLPHNSYTPLPDQTNRIAAFGGTPVGSSSNGFEGQNLHAHLANSNLANTHLGGQFAGQFSEGLSGAFADQFDRNSVNGSDHLGDDQFDNGHFANGGFSNHMGNQASNGQMYANPQAEPVVIQPLWETEKRAILTAIDSCNGNIPKAAAMLGISASTIYRKKQSWEAEMKKQAAKAEAEARSKMQDSMIDA
ncbi:MAG: sigma 54-interacting transcriptional regulator, partial [Alphaproteobacteria bacterium]